MNFLFQSISTLLHVSLVWLVLISFLLALLEYTEWRLKTKWKSKDLGFFVYLCFICAFSFVFLYLHFCFLFFCFMLSIFVLFSNTCFCIKWRLKDKGLFDVLVRPVQTVITHCVFCAYLVFLYLFFVLLFIAFAFCIWFLFCFLIFAFCFVFLYLIFVLFSNTFAVFLY